MAEGTITQEEQPQPAKPILASHLLELEELRRKKFTSNGRPLRLSSGCAEIDSLLGGEGIERGIVVGISSDGDDGRLVSLPFNIFVRDRVFGEGSVTRVVLRRDGSQLCRVKRLADDHDRSLLTSWLQS